MLPTAVKLLLALVLCLNGFLAPVAMAAHAVMAEADVAAEMPCHGMDEADATADEIAADSGTDHPSCCKPGHCLCAGVFSLSLPDSVFAGSVAGSGAVRDLSAAASLRTMRLPVPLRPPIA